MIENLKSNHARWETLLWLSGLLVTTTCIALTLIGTVLQYDPIPPFDTWDIKLHFIVQIIDGNYDAWLKYNFEHFYLIPRLLFWLDYKLFNCNNIFLICVNVSFLILSGLFCLKILKDLLPDNPNRISAQFIAMFMLTMMFLWDQHSNLRSGMLVQYYPTELLMLGAFYYLHRDTQAPESSWRNYILSILMAVGSICSMANGLLALPLMCVYALIMRMSRLRIIGLCVITLVCFSLYYAGYKSPNEVDSISYFFAHPLEAYHFVIMFMGHPFHFMFGENAYSSLIAYIAGQVLVTVILFQGYRCLSDRHKKSLQIALAFFILATIGTAAMAAGGRLFKSVMYSLVGRYSVPAIFGWVAFIAFLAPSMYQWLEVKKIKAQRICLVLLLTVIPMQLTALSPNYNAIYAHKVAALALSLQIHDRQPMRTIYFDKGDNNYKRVLMFAKETLDRNLSIFSRDPYRQILDQWGKPYPVTGVNQCQGEIYQIQIIPEDEHYLRIRGWIADPKSQTVPEIVRFLDQNNRVVGVALTGLPQDKLSDQLGKAAGKAGFVGYLLADHQGKQVTVQANRPACHIQVMIPQIASKPSAPATQ